jgi:hypothetical protein
MSLLGPLRGSSAALGRQLEGKLLLASDSFGCKSLGFKCGLVRFPYLDI